ncbi:MAG: AlpA family phage regulatory protein [Thermodesulfobacteriota bacterium]
MCAELEELRILRLAEVKRLTGLGKTSIYKLMGEGNFPRAVSLGSRAVGWIVRDIRGWLQERNFASL